MILTRFRLSGLSHAPARPGRLKTLFMLTRATASKENMIIKAFLVCLYYFHLASGETHSHKVIYTATSGLQTFPEFVAETFVDGQQVNYYDSKIQKVIPRQEWVKEAVDPDFWDRNTNIRANMHQTFKANIQTAMQRFNQTGGIHVFQLYYGCEWDDGTGATKGFQEFGYDGQDLISLDLEHLRYIAAVPQAFASKQKWDANRGLIEDDRQYYNIQCIDWLKKYVGYGSSTLGRKAPPKVSLFPKDSSTVVCHATGFYPEAVMITWKRNGIEVTDDMDVGETLPNADGNFQKRAVLTVPLEDRKNSKYTCEVTHGSGQPIVMIMNEDESQIRNPDSGSVPYGPIIGGVVGLLVLIAVIAVLAHFVVPRIKKSGFTRANTDESSQSSSEKA